MDKTVYQLDSNGYLVGTVVLDDTDKCPITGEYLIPGGCVESDPPTVDEQHIIRFLGDVWLIEEKVPDTSPTTDTSTDSAFSKVNVVYKKKSTDILIAKLRLATDGKDTSPLDRAYSVVMAEWKQKLLEVSNG